VTQTDKDIENLDKKNNELQKVSFNLIGAFDNLFSISAAL
jgi:hypothetical protein